MNPNIVFFFTDQQRWDTCGCYGQKLNTTPHLDAMAEEGVLFENAFTCQPVCGPARACLQTGRYATATGCFRNDIALPQNEKTIAHYFREKGYSTGYIGKWHLASNKEAGEDFTVSPVPPERRGGWEEWLASDVLEFTSHGYGGHLFDAEGNKREWAEDVYRADAMTRYALEFIDSHANQQKPFFLFLSYIEPHHQNDRNRYEGPKGSSELFGNFQPPPDLEGCKGDWKENYPDYLGAVHALDKGLGRIRQRLKELNIEENTLVVFASDHGSHFKTRNSEYKRSCHEASIHVPLAACGPGFRGGQRCNRLVSLIDLPPTFLRAGGITPPPGMAGTPLQEELSAASPERNCVFLQISEDHIGRAIRTRRWKYEITANTDNPQAGWNFPCWDIYKETCLYNLEADPWEKNNLVMEPSLSSVREKLQAMLTEQMKKAGEKPPLKIVPAGKS